MKTRNPIDSLSEGLGCQGSTVSVMRKQSDGTLRSVEASELNLLKTSAQVAGAANALKNLTPSERLDWALHTKNMGNEKYKEGNITEATSLYMESLSAAQFGESANSGNSNNNTLKLVLPVLCNLAACMIQQENWGKAIQLCDQAIQLDPQCGKAYMRKGLGFYHVAEFEEALQCFDKAMEYDETAVGETHLGINALDMQRIKIYIAKAKQGLAVERKSRLSQKQSLQRYFSKPEKEMQPSPQFKSSNAQTTRNKIVMYIVEAVNYILLYIIGVLRQLVERRQRNL